MDRTLKTTLFLAGIVASFSAVADYTVTMNAIDDKGVQKAIGTVKIAASANGVTFTPSLTGLAPGDHGFHVHEKGSCAPGDNAGKMDAGYGAGPHYDPAKTGKHAGPTGNGHRGDLPALTVDASGAARTAVLAPALKLDELKGRSLMIHAGGDNNTDQPANGGGGARIACGLIN